jgi:hypothetical protein
LRGILIEIFKFCVIPVTARAFVFFEASRPQLSHPYTPLLASHIIAEAHHQQSSWKTTIVYREKKQGELRLGSLSAQNSTRLERARL